MKKFLTFVLALVMVLAIAAPAMAFTSKAKTEVGEYGLDIYLVEYDDDEFFGLTSLPPTDRGYAKNEIVAAIAELKVPEDADTILPADYPNILFYGENVDLNVADNIGSGRNLATTKNVVIGDAKQGKWANSINADDELAFNIGTEGFADDDTYKFLFFAKVTGDDAELSVKLNADDTKFGDPSGSTGVDSWMHDALVVDDDYVVEGHADDEYVVYKIRSGDMNDRLLFKVIVDPDEDNETTGLVLFLLNGSHYDEYTAVALASGMGFIHDGDVVDEDTDEYDDLMELYDDVFVDVFGFDFGLMGGVVDDDTFYDINGSDDLEATVEIVPWTAYVSIPDVVVVDPPKTGDAAGILGFVMIVLAAAAVVAVRKVRA